MASLAIVTPWFGEDLTGGAERIMFESAHLLARRGHDVQVLTTCCRSFFDDWGTNHLPHGVKRERDVTVHRFPVDRRNRRAFDLANETLLAVERSVLRPGVLPVSEATARDFVRENIHSSALYRLLRERGRQFDALLFGPYLYGVVLSGLREVADRAVLLPCLHDEAYAYLPQMAELFRQPARLAFNSEGEFLLATRLYGPALHARSGVVGLGIPSPAAAPAALGHVGPIDLRKDRYLLYLGRRVSTKNTDLLCTAYRRFTAANPDTLLRLVLAGPGDSSYGDPSHGIHDLGLVSEEAKQALLAHALALAQPSENESYSRTIMEAWWQGRPVLAHGECLATATAVGCSGGGLVAIGEQEWAERIAELDRTAPEALAHMGGRGRLYALEYADWDRAMDRLESTMLNLKQRQRPARPRPVSFAQFHQMVAGFAVGDAISDEALVIQILLRQRGYLSEIFAEHLDAKAARKAHVYQPGDLPPEAGLIYHHSIGGDLAEVAAAHPGPKVLVYHNITPAEFFAPYERKIACLLEQGRQQLRELARHFPVSLADSAFNAAELAASGYRAPGVLPLPVDPSDFPVEPDPRIMRALQDGFTNIVFVGRIAPSKKQDELVRAFAEYLNLDGSGRLILVGRPSSDSYQRALIRLIEELGVRSRVLLPGVVEANVLAAIYRTAHLLWSMSEHEGFGVPLVEAMWYDVPVLAYKSTAVPETLGRAGILFTSKEDLRRVAALAHLLVKERGLRETVLTAQRERRLAFTRARFEEAVDRLLDRMEALPRIA